MSAEIFDLVQESVVRRDRDGAVTGWNAASERLYGWTRSDALGRPVHELLKTRREFVPQIEAELNMARGRAMSCAGPQTACSSRCG